MLNTSTSRYTALQTITKITPKKISVTVLKHRVSLKNMTLNKTKKPDNTTRSDSDSINDETLERSLRRTQSEIADIIDCNDFVWFGTLTLSPDKVNRLDDDEVLNKVNNFLKVLRRNSPKTQYLLVPERHKDGALHFHALFTDLSVPMVDSGKKWHNEPIYNLKPYTLGFSNFTKIRDKAKTANYCRKYITKDLLAMRKNKKRYWASRGLNRPERIDNLALEDVEDAFRVKKDDAYLYENDFVLKYTFTLKQNEGVTTHAIRKLSNSPLE